MSDEKLNGIIRKIQGLLAVADGNANEEEAQSAFVIAQKLMMKYNLDLSEVQKTNENEVNITKGQTTAYKKLYWYERVLAGVVSKNFRVKQYLTSKYISNKSSRSAVMFFGLEHDVKIAKEVFIIALDALEKYSKRYVDNHYKQTGLPRTRTYTSHIKNGYISGFLSGLSKKLEEQTHSLKQEYGLVVLTPKVVEEQFEDFSKSFTKSVKTSVPSNGDIEAYRKGVSDGEKIDYSKSSIGDNIELF